MPDYPEEESLLDSIDGATSFRTLYHGILALHCRGNLQKPLLGRIDATIHLFRANDDKTDIIQFFTTTLLPPQDEPTNFMLTIEDLLRRGVAEEQGLDPDEVVQFELEKMRMVVAKQIPKQELARARDRAKAAMKKQGVGRRS